MAETTPPLECSLRSSEDTRECSWFRKASLRETLFPKVTETHAWRSSALLLAPGTRPLQCRPLESHSRAWLSQATLGSPFRGLTRASSHLPGHHSTGRFCGIAPVSHDVMKLFLDKEGPSLQYLYSGPQNTFAGDLFWKLPNRCWLIAPFLTLQKIHYLTHFFFTRLYSSSKSTLWKSQPPSNSAIFTFSYPFKEVCY